jgi:hypothetical protein
MRSKYILILALFSLLIWGCEDYYVPELQSVEQALVVECQLTNLNEFVTIRLGRTVPFDKRSYFFAERHATVTLRSVSGEEFATKEVLNGVYQTIEKVAPRVGEGYFLKMITKDGLEYQSRVEEMMPPTDIANIQLADTIVREVSMDYWGDPYVNNFPGVQISVLPEKPLREDVGFIYKWNALVNYYVLCGAPPMEYSFYCWKNMVSSLVYNYDFNDDETGNQLILDDVNFLSYYALSPQPIDSSRFFVKNQQTKKNEIVPIAKNYSTGFYYRLRQYTVTNSGAEFWKGVKKQSEATGKLFDPVEEQLSTNIFCVTDPSVPAFGFFNTAAVVEKILKIDLTTKGFENVSQIDIMPVTEMEEDCLLFEKPDFWF